MDEEQGLPGIFQKVQHSLRPYIKHKREATQIRKVLAAHLSSHVKQDDDYSLSRPLSLVDATCSAESTPHVIRGLQKEYLRCLRANIRAQNEYSEVGNDNRHGREDDGASKPHAASTDEFDSSMKSSMELVRQRQKHERLRIIHDYLDVLAQKPAANVEHLDPQTALRDVDTLPKMPSEVLNSSDVTGQRSSRIDLKELVEQLEKSVLRAKMLLKREQNLLAKVKADNAIEPGSLGSRLEAVGITRSALINWIEAELSRAGEGSAESENQDTASHDERGQLLIDSELASIHRQYARYMKAREALITAAAGTLDPPTKKSSEDEAEISIMKEEPYSSNGIEIIHPYLLAMISISNEQKAIVQQKSHLTISLSKQLKEANQGLDRLADESHLLPAHPMPTLRMQRNGLEGPISLEDKISSHEKPDSSVRARAWVHSAQCATQATKVSVAGNLDEGSTALAEAHQTLLELQSLLGVNTEASRRKGDQAGDRTVAQKSRDIWAALDGTLGAIKGDGSD